MRSKKKKAQRRDFRSNFEFSIARNLEKRNVNYEYETLTIHYGKRVRGGSCLDCGSKNVQSAGTYTPDFILDNGIIIEAKGKLTSQNRTKMQDVKRSNPDLDIRFLFQRNNWLTRKKLQTYGDWCDKNGFGWAVLEIPQDWVDEE